MAKKILVVDDRVAEQHNLCLSLSELDVEVVLASNGKDGVQQAKAELPDLILMDIVMPEMDGFAAVRAIKNDSDTQHIPVLMVSTKNQQADQVWAQLQGANGLIPKPLCQSTLLKEVSQWI